MNDMTTVREMMQEVQVQTHPETMMFSVYKVSIEHPDTWQIYINPSKTFAFHDGFVKIDKAKQDKKSIPTSMTIRWAKPREVVDVDTYVEEVKNQYIKKQHKNKKDYYEILSVTPVMLEHKSYLIHATFTANHSVYRALGKDEDVDTLQIATVCEETGRIVVATISTTPEQMEQNYEYYKELLMTLRCH